MIPREYTREEVQKDFLKSIHFMIYYWDNLSDKSSLEKLYGFTHSLLTIIDGCGSGLPAFILAPCPHPNDKAYNQENEESWYPENHECNVQCDISGGLHELLYKEGPKELLNTK